MEDGRKVGGTEGDREEGRRKEIKKEVGLPMKEMWVQSLGREDPMEKEMVTHSSILAWEIPRTDESMGSRKSQT